MRDEAAIRLEKLRHDYEIGQHQLHKLEQESATVRDTLLRISGAIQVLEELLAPTGPNGTTREGPDSNAATLSVP